jgi:hypothetical protein
MRLIEGTQGILSLSEHESELELNRGEIPYWRVIPLYHVNIFNEVSDLTGRIGEIEIFV